MGAHAAPASAGPPTLTIRGRAYPVLLPKLRDPRLHLAATITSLQVIGQIGFHFRLSIAQILIALVTCAVLEVGIAARKQHVLMWPASAMLTGNGVAFVLRVPGTRHGDWWSTRGWWIFAATAAVSLLSKHVLQVRGTHVFNPSNIGLVLCFLVLPVSKAEPLDFWWGPMSGWLVLALAVILAGGFTILSRLSLLRVALGFWASFAAGLAVLAAAGHQMTARWHLGPIGGIHFWWVLVTSPEVLVFLFFMITDPRTAPRGPRARVAYAVSLGLLASLLIAPMRTEYWSKVALLGALAIVCLAQALIALVPRPLPRLSMRTLVPAGAAAFAAYAAALVVVNPSPAATVTAAMPTGHVPQVTIEHSSGVATQLSSGNAHVIAADLVADLDLQAKALRTHDLDLAATTAGSDSLVSLRQQIAAPVGEPIAVPTYSVGHVTLSLEPGRGQGPPIAVAVATGTVQRVDYRGRPPVAVRTYPAASFTRTFELQQKGSRFVLVSSGAAAPAAPRPAAPRSGLTASSGGVRLQNVAGQVGLDFQQDSFRYGMSNDYRAMMGGGVCWLDYNGDGWMDLFAVNSYASADTAQWETHGGLPRTALFENDHGRFHDVTRKAEAGLQVQGDGCVAADLNGDGHTDLVVTTTTGIDLLWNDGNGTFSEGARAAGMTASGWYTGATVADVNGDGRPDVFIAGYTDPNTPVPYSSAGFPTDDAGVRDLLYLNEGNAANGRARFREVGIQAGLESAQPRHGLGALFTDVNGDGRPDLYVANDEDPNQLYENVPWPGGAKADPAGLGFRFEERAVPEGVADQYAGMGVATTTDGSGRLGLFVTNSRREPSAAFRQLTVGSTFANARPSFDQALGTDFAGWGASWIDFANSGSPDLVLAAGAIPVTSLAGDAEQVRVLAPAARALRTPRFGDARQILGARGLLLNGRGLAAADAGNDGRMVVAVNTIGGKLVLLRSSGPAGHWLDVSLSRFSPGAVVTVALPDGKRLVGRVQAGSSYLSSEDPRLHFGLGSATRATSITVRYPWGAESRLSGVRADRVVDVAVPQRRQAPAAAASSYVLAGCAPVSLHGRSVAALWNETAVTALRAGGAAEPVQARDLFHLSAAMWDAWAAYDPGAHGFFVDATAHAPASVLGARDAAISFAAYRLLLWRASIDSNIASVFASLTARLRSLCYSPAFTRTTGDSPAALGNRIAAAAIAYGRNDGSFESLHYIDPSYVPQNGPLVVAQAGSTVHDATFWQPLALGQVAARGLAPVPARIQTFTGASWGRVRGFAVAATAKGRAALFGAPSLGDPAGAAYKQAAVAVIRATAGRTAARSTAAASPLAWNLVADALPGHGSAAARLRRDVELELALDGALGDAAIEAWDAKRTYQSPRPISMIRYLAFEGQASDPKAASYNAEGLPLVPGLIELITTASSARGRRHAALAAHVGQVTIRSGGRWVLGTRWTPPAATPASPGWVSEDSAFAYAASTVLSALGGRSFAAQAAAASRLGVASGTALPEDVVPGRRVGTAVGGRALAKALRLAS
ncbi:MAG TPA: FG-GAP-like repeat-containing protein [Gaiellaceae bacterium]|nr:FG-GAP-like repeat-containing protein [Gaiellaceae bacterium]